MSSRFINKAELANEKADDINQPIRFKLLRLSLHPHQALDISIWLLLLTTDLVLKVERADKIVSRKLLAFFTFYSIANYSNHHLVYTHCEHFLTNPMFVPESNF